MMERPIDFERLRYMRCGTCSHEWGVDAEWLDRFDDSDESCPECGTDGTSEHYPTFWVRPQDPAHDDDAVRNMYWYHSSTHSVWPDKDFDPAAQFTDQGRQRMEESVGPGGLADWIARQKSKALHLGTYEAAIENMLRRMADQADAASQFYLHRVKLRSECVIEPGIHEELPSYMGDVHLSDKCAPGVEVFRYANVHEDPSGVSLAVEISAIGSVQSIPIPLAVDADDPELRAATARLFAAAARPPEPPPLPEDTDDPLEKLLRRHYTPSTPLASEASALRQEESDRLPPLRRTRLDVEFDEAGFPDDPGAYPAKLIGLQRLFADPRAVVDALSAQPWRNL